MEIQFEELKEAFHICTCELNDKKSRSKTEFFRLYKKLMPLHGYPRNTALLEGLNEQMQNFFKEKAEDYVDPVTTYQVNLFFLKHTAHSDTLYFPIRGDRISNILVNC